MFILSVCGYLLQFLNIVVVTRRKENKVILLSMEKIKLLFSENGCRIINNKTFMRFSLYLKTKEKSRYFFVIVFFLFRKNYHPNYFFFFLSFINSRISVSRRKEWKSKKRNARDRIRTLFENSLYAKTVVETVMGQIFSLLIFHEHFKSSKWFDVG